jgi:hypothetical protein
MLRQELDLQSEREIDELVIDSIYAGIVVGKIDQQERIFRVSNCISRDVKSSDVSKIVERLKKI